MGTCGEGKITLWRRLQCKYITAELLFLYCGFLGGDLGNRATQFELSPAKECWTGGSEIRNIQTHP